MDDHRENDRRLQDRVLASDFHELADTVLGSRRTDLEGGGRNHDGLTHDMKAVKRDVAEILKTNGGTVRLTIAQKVGAGIVFAFLVWREVEPLIGG